MADFHSLPSKLPHWCLFVNRRGDIISGHWTVEGKIFRAIRLESRVAMCFLLFRIQKACCIHCIWHDFTRLVGIWQVHTENASKKEKQLRTVQMLLSASPEPIHTQIKSYSTANSSLKTGSLKPKGVFFKHIVYFFHCDLYFKAPNCVKWA